MNARICVIALTILLTALCSGCATTADWLPRGLPLGQADLVTIEHDSVDTTTTTEIRDTTTIAKLVEFFNALPNNRWGIVLDYPIGGQYYFKFHENGTTIGDFYIGLDIISRDGGGLVQRVSQQQLERLGNIVGIDFLTHTYTPSLPLAADSISSSDTIAQAKATLQEYFVAWNAKDAARLSTVTSHRLNAWDPRLERIEVGNISVYSAEENNVVFEVPIRLFHNDTLERNPPDAQALFHHYSVVRGADGRWRVNGY